MKNINIENLTVAYNKNVVIKDLNVCFNENRVNIIIGQSGCGKTTLLKAITGQLSYDGNIYFDNIDVDKIPTNERNISYVSQDIVLYPHLTVFENIAFPLKLLNCPKEEIIKRVNEIAKEFEIELLLNRKPKQLSLGQMQRVAIARALIKNPDICLFDEPLSNLDEQNRYKLRHVIKKVLQKRHITTIYVTHNRTIALALGDYIYVMDNGTLVASGTQTELLESSSILAKELLGEENV